MKVESMEKRDRESTGTEWINKSDLSSGADSHTMAWVLSKCLLYCICVGSHTEARRISGHPLKCWHKVY